MQFYKCGRVQSSRHYCDTNIASKDDAFLFDYRGASSMLVDNVACWDETKDLG